VSAHGRRQVTRRRARGNIPCPKKAGLIVAEVKQMNTQVGAALLVLYDARLTPMTSNGMLLMGEERLFRI
jgi:hypothetical protein